MIPALALAAALAAAPPGADTLQRNCYNLGQGGSTHYYPVSDRTILVSSGIHAYRIEVVPAPGLGLGSTGLQVRGAGVVCSPLDIQLYAVGPGIARTPLIIRSITPLPPAAAEELRHGVPKRSVLRR